MTGKTRSARSACALLAGLAMLVLAPRAHAQWADQRYQYRVPLTVSNSTTHAYAAGDLVTATLPGSALSGNVRPDGADVALYYNGAPISSKTLVMGGSVKTIFALPAGIGAAAAYGISENLSAGKTNYAGLPAGTKLTFTGGVDDNSTVITLPFNFPFKTGSFNKLTVNIDGYVTPGSADAGRSDNPDTVNGTAQKNVIVPYGSDFMLGDGTNQDATTGIYADTSDPTKVTIRWEVKPSGGSSVVAKFACQLYPDGKIRFIYSNLVNQDMAAVTWSDPHYGVGVGDPTTSLITATGDMSNHDDILYTQSIPTPVTQAGYSLYFGGPSVSTAPALPAGLIGWDFSDGQLHGWKSNENPNGTGGPSDDARIAPDPVGSETSLYLNTVSGLGTADWVFVAQDMSPIRAQTVYTKVRPTGGDKALAIMMRYNSALSTDSNGAPYYAPVEPRGVAVFFEYGDSNTYGVVTDRRNANTTNGREQTDFPIFGGSKWTIDETKIQYLVTATDDVNSATWVYGKAWQAAPGAATPETDPAPGSFQFGWDSSGLASSGTVQTGKAAIDVTVPTYLHWMWVVPNASAENVATNSATVETAPLPGTGKAVLQGVAYDNSVGPTAVLAGIAVTVKDAGGNTLGSATTDVTGKYRFVINASATPADVTVKGTAVGKSGTATVSAVENTVYTVNLPIAFGARAEGYVVDTATGGGIPGASIKFLTPGTTTAVYQATIDATGRYQVDMDSTGPFDVSVSVPGYTSATEANKTFQRGVSTAKNYVLTAQEMLANGGMESEEAAPNPPGEAGAMKPVGFIPWNQTTAADESISNDMAAMDAGTSISLFYYNRADAGRAHGGTHSIAIRNTSRNTTQWVTQSGNLVPTTPGMMYRISMWTKVSAAMDARLRIRFLNSVEDPKPAPGSDYDGLQYWLYPNQLNRDWQKVEAVLAAPTGGPKYIVLRPHAYGPADSTATTETLAYFDDFSVTPVAPRLVTGTVVDGTGAPVANIVVAASVGRNALANPDASAVTDANGAFTLRLPLSGVFNVQTWKAGSMARNQASIDTTQTVGPIGPVTLTAPTVPAYNMALAINANTTDGKGATGPAILDNAPDVDAFDGATANRGGGVWTQWRTKSLLDLSTQLPITLNADLGRLQTFSQITMQWELRAPIDFEILASTDGASYTSIYSANGLGYQNYPANSNERDDVITFTTPVTARYLRVVSKVFPLSGATSFALWEMRVETPGNVVNGTVLDSSKAPVANAFVGTKNAIGNVYYFAKTDATGAYSMVLPTTTSADVVAHFTPSPDSVIAPTEPVRVTASPNGPITLAPIVLGASTPNLMPTTTVTASDPSSDEGANPSTNAVDRNFSTRWGTDGGSAPTPDSPMRFNFDMGSPVTFNQVNILWEYGWANWYTIEASTDGNTYTPIYSTTSNYSGYSFGSGQFMDVVKVPKTTTRYLRIVAQYKETQWTSMWEVQLANVSPVPFALTRQALRIIAGFDAAPTPATNPDFTALDAVTTGTSAGKIDYADAVTLARQSK